MEQEYQNTKDTKTYQRIKTLKLKIKINDLLLEEVEKRNKFVKQNYYEAGSKATKLRSKMIC